MHLTEPEDGFKWLPLLHLEVVHQKIKTSTSMNYELQYEEHDEEEIVVKKTQNFNAAGF